MPRRQMRSPPDWDEKIAKFYGVELQSVRSSSDGVRFKFKEGGQCTLVNVTIGDEKRTFAPNSWTTPNSKLEKVEIISCHQQSQSGELPVRSSCSFLVKSENGNSFLFHAFNEHDGSGGESANFQFDVVK